MSGRRATVILIIRKRNFKADVDIPLYITANELVTALNLAYQLGIDSGDIQKCLLKTENPIALLRGDKLVAEYGVRDGTIINITA